MLLVRFPGYSCPGLIEAAHRCLRRGRRWREFPGIHAPASLKRVAPLGRESGSGVFRGLCPGFIEVLIRRREGQHGYGVSQGFHAPASLKQEVVTDYIGQQLLFPGHSFPGLIKVLLIFG